MNHHEEPAVCPKTGLVILEKPQTFFGMSVMTTVLLAITVVLSIIGATWSVVDDAKVQRMVLLQGAIAIGAGLTYAAFYNNY